MASAPHPTINGQSVLTSAINIEVYSIPTLAKRQTMVYLGYFALRRGEGLELLLGQQEGSQHRLHSVLSPRVVKHVFERSDSNKI